MTLASVKCILFLGLVDDVNNQHQEGVHRHNGYELHPISRELENEMGVVSHGDRHGVDNYLNIGEACSLYKSAGFQELTS